MHALKQPLRLAGKLALVLCLVGISGVAIHAADDTTPADPTTLALKSWHGYLEQIGWPQEMRERIAPEFLGKQTQSVANEFGGQTVTFDGSKPGLLAPVTLVLGADGLPVRAPVVELADIVEAR